MAAGIEHPNVVDLITHNPRTDEYALIMIENREWNGSPEQLEQLQLKINNYLIFALDGGLVREYPQSAGCPVRLQLDCVQWPSGQAAQFLDLVSGQLDADYNIRLVVNVLD
ncbi:MAG: DUF6572 domain-containing protein [Labedaea sp.]